MVDDARTSAVAAIDEQLRAAGSNGPLHIVDPCGFQDQPIPERQWIVPDWIPCGVATGLYGPGGYGKSLLAQQLMTAAAIGKPWIGLPVSSVRSLGVFCEDDEDELRRRQAAINHQLYGCDFRDLANMRWVPRLGEDNLLMTFEGGIGKPTAFFNQIRDAAVAFGAKLVVIDTIADTFGGNQNDAGHARQYVQFGLAGLARAIGGAVLACAHPSRAGITSKTGESGSVQWDAAFRSRLFLSAPGKQDDDEPVGSDARVLMRVKANYAPRDGTIDLRWFEGVLMTGGAAESVNQPDAETVFLTLLDKMTAEKLGCDPIEGMARIAMDEANAVELRARMYAELAGYVAPKRKAVDVSSEDGSRNEPVEIVVRVVRPDPANDDDRCPGS